ncbi:MAG: MCP four helix bundle domain-containing protein [Burkholderiaceae bacterium]|nr:MCP four helix bundle domain-containing protein [Burkholderiaceae bacterium]
MSLSNLRVATKLGLSFGLMLAISMALGVFAVERMRSIYSAGDVVASKWLPGVTALSEIRDNVNALRHAQGSLLLAQDEPQRDAARTQFRKASADLKADMARYEAFVRSNDEREKYDRFTARLAVFVDGDARIQALALEGEGSRHEAITVFNGDSRRALNATYEAIDALIEHNAAGSAADVAGAHATMVAAQTTIAAALAIALFVGSALGVALVRSINRPLRQVLEENARIATGDLCAVVDGDGRRDELGSLLDSTAAMRQSLRRTVHEVNTGVATIATASAQIAAGATDLSGRTEEQASNLQQAAASLEQLSSTVGHNAESANQANQFAASAHDVATRGGDIVTQVVGAMEEIATSSRQVSAITATIDSIAFQTNILALNAAVEAARAGEQGRGFAVVADEVRNLAQRSAQAAREIKSLVAASMQRIASGTSLASEAGATMQEIQTHVRRVNDLMNEISAASTEQASGLVQINQAVASLDAMTQQNAAMVEESAASAGSLQDQASRLRTLLASFKLDDASAAQYREAPPPAPGAAPVPGAGHDPANDPPHPGGGSHAHASPAAQATRSSADFGSHFSAHSPTNPSASSGQRPARTRAATPGEEDWQTF